MTPVYSNAFNMNLNEIAILDFRINSQPVSGTVALVAVNYEFLKQIYTAIGEAIEQHDKRLHEVQRTKGNMN